MRKDANVPLKTKRNSSFDLSESRAKKAKTSLGKLIDHQEEHGYHEIQIVNYLITGEPAWISRQNLIPWICSATQELREDMLLVLLDSYKRNR